jgi:hypothetical protein
VPATIGVAAMVAALFLGALLRTDSHWLLPVAMLAFSGLGSGLFNAPNHAAMINSVPREHRGFANGALQLMFNLGHVLGISLGSFLMTATFRLHTGMADAAPSTSEPTAFVAALNSTYGVAVAFAAVALITSAMRGPKAAEG